MSGSVEAARPVARLTPLADGFLIPEGLRWRDGAVWMSDLMDGKVYRVDADGKKHLLADFPGRTSGLGFLPDGSLIVSSMEDRTIYRIMNGERVVFADLSDYATGDLNELVTDNSGMTYVGNFGYDYMGGAEPRLAHLHMVTSEGTISQGPGDLAFANGMVLLDGGRTLVVAETWVKKLTAFDRANDGTLSNGRLYADLGDRTPDGLCVDAEDGIWISSFATGEFVRLSKERVVTDVIALPGHICFSCLLGGDDGKTLYLGAYNGTVDDIFAGRFKGFVATTRVSIAGAG